MDYLGLIGKHATLELLYKKNLKIYTILRSKLDRTKDIKVCQIIGASNFYDQLEALCVVLKYILCSNDNRLTFPSLWGFSALQ